MASNSFADENPFAGTGDAALFESGEYIAAGDYILEIEDTITKKTRKSGLAYIAECRILEVFTTSKPETHYVGAKVTYFQKLDQDSALSNLKAHALGVLGVATKDREGTAKASKNIDAILHATTSGDAIGKIPGKCLVGRKVRCTAVDKVSKLGNDYTALTWTPYVEAV